MRLVFQKNLISTENLSLQGRLNVHQQYTVEPQQRDGGIDVVLFNQSRKQEREESNAPEDFPFTKPALQKTRIFFPLILQRCLLKAYILIYGYKEPSLA